MTCKVCGTGKEGLISCACGANGWVQTQLSDAVAVCAIRDIAGCHHMRSSSVPSKLAARLGAMAEAARTNLNGVSLEDGADFQAAADILAALQAAIFQHTVDADDDNRPCTCHPDNRPIGICQKKYAASDCNASATQVKPLVWEDECSILDFPCSYAINGDDDDEDGWRVSATWSTSTDDLKDLTTYRTSDAAKAAAQADYAARIVAALVPAPAVPADAGLVGAIKYRKKPVVIEAVQWTGKNLREVISFTDGSPETRSHHAGMMWEQYEELVSRDGLKIFTLEGKMDASVGDFIIRGVAGELYPCKPGIFAATYERAAAITALRARQTPAPVVGYLPSCPECKGSGQRDSGGVHPWGEGIFLACDCDQPPTPAPQVPPEVLRQVVESLAFYADSQTYETQYERMSCDCCTDIFEPINADKGGSARAALAAVQPYVEGV